MRICKHELSVIVPKKGDVRRVHPLKFFAGFWLVEEERKEEEGEAKRSNCLHMHFPKIKWDFVVMATDSEARRSNCLHKHLF